jgi:hypothetical protein
LRRNFEGYAKVSNVIAKLYKNTGTRKEASKDPR